MLQMFFRKLSFFSIRKYVKTIWNWPVTWGGFFFGIARNVWNNLFRQKSKTEELHNIDIVEENDEEVSDQLFMKIMTRAFNKLKPECQEVLKMFYDGLSFEEIAQKMNYKNETYARRKKYLCKGSFDWNHKIWSRIHWISTLFKIANSDNQDQGQNNKEYCFNIPWDIKWGIVAIYNKCWPIIWMG